MDSESENLNELIEGCMQKPKDSVESSIKRWTAPTQPAPVTVLEPEHPLMQKFQNALKAYLLKENERVSEQIIELKNNLKKSKLDYENQMTNEMYYLEQDVKGQRDAIKQYEENLENSVKYRESKERELKEVREMHKEKMDLLNKRKKDDLELRKDLDEYNWILKQYEKRKDESNCERTVSQRVSEKMIIEKKEKAQRQKELDVMLYKLTTEVWNLEAKIALIEEQTAIKKHETDLINNRIVESTADMDSLNVEHKRLMKAWTAVINQIEKRDEVYTKLSDEYSEMEANFHVINAEIDGVKKEIGRAMQTHEEITISRDRVDADMENVQKLERADEKKKTELETAMFETNSLIEATENDLDRAKMENTNILNTLKVIMREIEKESQTKYNLENETLEMLQESLINNKASNVIAGNIRRLKEEVKKLELGVLMNENTQAKIVLQIEQQKEKNERLQKLLDEEKKLFDIKDKEVMKVEENIVNTLTAIERKQISLEMANKKLSSLLEQLQGVEKSPAQRKVDELESNISDITKEIKEMQQDWVRCQNRVVSLSDQKQAVSTDTNQRKRQIQVLEHKNLKLEYEIDILNKERNSITRSLNALQCRMEHLFEQRYDDYKHNEELEASYNHMTLDYVCQLKDIEERTLNLEEEIKVLEEERNKLEIDLYKIKREAMKWQKMVILTNETKQKISEEKGATGDIGKMKIEIHRMQVRQAQLNTLANRLADELAQGVVRREIAAGKAAGDPKRRRLAIQQGLKEKKSNICKLRQEIDEKKSAIENLQLQEKEFQELINEKVKIITDVDNHIAKLKIELDDLQDTKQKNLEHLVRLQHCGQMWSTIAGGHNLPSGRLTDAKNELIKQMQFTRSLKTFILQLMNLPNLDDSQKRKLQRALNTLKINENLTNDN